MADSYSEYGTSTELTDLDGLASLGAGYMWISEEITQAAGASLPFLEVPIKLPCDASCVDGDEIHVYASRGDGHASEIRDGGITASANDSTTNDADTIDDVEDACELVDVIQVDRANQDVEKIVLIEDPGPSVVLCLILNTTGGLDATGASVRKRFWQPGDGA